MHAQRQADFLLLGQTVRRCGKPFTQSLVFLDRYRTLSDALKSVEFFLLARGTLHRTQQSQNSSDMMMTLELR
jgi:hypothetical protein